MRIEFFAETLVFRLVHYSFFENKVQGRLQHQDILAVEREIISVLVVLSQK